MIERDTLHFNSLVESHQQHLRQEWQAAHQGPGPLRFAIGRRLVQFGEWIAGRHHECRSSLADALPPGTVAQLSR